MIRTTAVCVGLIAFVVAPLAGQAGPITLSLDDAVRIAHGSNPTYRQAVSNSSLNGVESRSTLFSSVLPRATLNLFGTNFYGNIQRNARDNFGNPIDNPTTDWVYFSNTSQSLDLTWQIQGSSIFNALSRQRLTNRDRDLAEERALTDLDVAVHRAFWDVLEQRTLLRTEERLLEARGVDRQVVERLFAVADRTRVDVLNAELTVEQQALTVQQQRATFERARLGFRTRLGDGALEAFQLEETPPPLFDPSGLDAATLVRTALDINPELRQAGVGVEASGVELKDSRRAWWPTLVLNYNARRRAQTTQAGALFDVSFDESLDHQFYIGLEVPAFNDFFGTKRDVQRSEIQLSNAREAQRAALLRIEETVQGALLDLSNQWETVRLSERAAQIAQEALRLAREEYRLGSRTFEQLRQSIDAEADTQRRVIQARFAFVDALLSLEEAVGTQVRG